MIKELNDFSSPFEYCMMDVFLCSLNVPGHLNHNFPQQCFVVPIYLYCITTLFRSQESTRTFKMIFVLDDIFAYDKRLLRTNLKP